MIYKRRYARVMALSATAFSFLACSSAPPLSGATPSIPEPVQIVASAETTAGTEIVVWGIDMTPDGHIYSTGYDTSSRAVVQFSQHDQLADKGKFTMEVTYPHEAAMEVERDASGTFAAKSSLLPEDLEMARHLDADLAVGDFGAPPSGVANLLSTSTRSTRVQDFHEAAQLLAKYGKCLYENRSCLRPAAKVGTELLSVASACATADVNILVLMGCIFASATNTDAPESKQCVAVAAELALQGEVACLAAFSSAPGSIFLSLAETSATCSTALNLCF